MAGRGSIVALAIAELLRLHPGQSHEAEWDGNFFTVNDDYCSPCACQDSNLIPDGNYGAVVRAHETFLCESEPCVEQDDGVIEGAAPSGDASESVVDFSIPYSADVVEISITQG
jgi:hypothetical protein